MSALHLTTIAFASLAFAGDASAQEPVSPDAVPWGISSSASSFRNHTEWFPKMAEAGISWVRLFPEWNGLEPAQGTWKWEPTDAMLKSAAANKIQINAILMGSTPWFKEGSHAFPMNNLEGWSAFVSTVADRYKGQVHHWEVWNEGNGGFNDGKHTTTDYAQLAAATYTAAKKADPKAQVGLTVASYDAPYLRQAMLAQAKAGKANHFDFLCIHPYELADGVGEGDGEIPYLWMTRTLRGVLKEAAPERADAEIWISEVGRRIEKRNGKSVTDADAAKAVVKLYTMAIAQGIKRTQWFEAQDPAGEEPGFGLLARDGAPRASYHALKTLSARLGAAPKTIGWQALGEKGSGYGFVFEGTSGAVLVAWMPGGAKGEMTFASDVEVIDWKANTGSKLKAGKPLSLTDAPVLVQGVPAEIVAQARANAAKHFPWGGDYSAEKAVSLDFEKPDGKKGVFQVGSRSLPEYMFPDTSKGIQIKANQSVSFFVHPSFANIQTKEYYVRITVRRIVPGSVGMNLNYEVADSQGRAAYKNRGIWFGLTDSADWQTHTWHVTDACFSKMWGYDFSLRPEKSVPFAIGKVEVSTVPF